MQTFDILGRAGLQTPYVCRQKAVRLQTFAAIGRAGVQARHVCRQKQNICKSDLGMILPYLRLTLS